MNRDTTDRTLAEHALRGSETLVSSLLQNARAGIGYYGLDGRVILFNDQALEFLGGTLDDHVGKSLVDLFGAKAGAEYIKRIQRAAEDPQTRSYEDLVPLESGHRWFSSHYTRILDRDGNVEGVMVVSHDVTEFKKTQRALERQALLLEAGQTIGSFGSWDWNFKIQEIWWSDGLFAIYGIEPSEEPPTFEDDHWLETIHPDDRAELVERLRRAISAGSDFQSEHRAIRRSDRALRWVHAKGRVLTDSAGRPERLIGVAQDVTERKEAEEALRKSESLLDRTGQMARVGGWDLDAKTMEVSWTRETYAIHEVPFGEMPSLDEAVNFWHPDDRPVLQEAIDRALRSGEPYDLVLRFVTAGGRELRARTICKPVVENGEVVRLEGTFQDVTEQLRVQAERRNLEQQLYQSQKIESLGRLAGGVAHDFNNMLGVILGHLDIVLSDMQPNDPLYGNVTSALKAAERSAELTNQLLAFARRQTVTPKVLDLNETIASLFDMMARLVGEEIDLHFERDASIWPVRIDPSQVHQILVNLCVNARDAIDGPGKIEIGTGRASFDEAFCAEHPGATPGDYVSLVVSDTGCGMDESTRQRAFEPFFTTKGQGQGTGLGLSTVFGIVKQNDGFIDIESSLGHGATLRVFIPRHLGKAEQMDTTTPEQPVRAGQGTVLLVEDDPGLLALSQTMLRRLGYDVLPAQTPMEAIAVAQSHPGEIHLLVTDVIMPEMDGRQLAGRLLSIYPDIRRLFMSGYTADVIAHRGVLDEGVNFLQKPFKSAELAEAVKKALR